MFTKLIFFLEEIHFRLSLGYLLLRSSKIYAHELESKRMQTADLVLTFEKVRNDVTDAVNCLSMNVKYFSEAT